MGSHVFNLGSKLVCTSAQSLLEATQKLVLFALSKRKIVVSQLTVFLFKFALNFVPSPFHLYLHNTQFVYQTAVGLITILNFKPL